MWAMKRVALAAVGLVVALAAPAAADEEDSVGLVDPGNSEWWYVADGGDLERFTYGNPGDLPVLGDWDGDGDDTAGMYRQSDGFFYARNSNSTGIADDECFAGDPEDVPLAGDWDGDGVDTLGLYRPSEQQFYLFDDPCADAPMGAADVALLFGDPGDQPVAGDWDGDGMDEVGLHRPTTGFFHWRNANTTGVADGSMFFGDPGDRFVAGDWGVVDGVDTPAVWRGSDQTIYYRHTLSQGNADASLAANRSARSLPVAGDFEDPSPAPPGWPPCDFAPFTVSGGKADNGDPVVRDLVVPGDRPATVVFTAEGLGNFAVNALDAAGNTIGDGGLLVNAVAPYEGVRPANHRAKFPPVRKVRVSAPGDWTAEVKPMCAARKLTGASIGGAGDEVVQVDRSGTATYSHSGPFGTQLYSYQGPEERDQLVFAKSGTFAVDVVIVPGTVFVDIRAGTGGTWTLSLP